MLSTRIWAIAAGLVLVAVVAVCHGGCRLAAWLRRSGKDEAEHARQGPQPRVRASWPAADGIGSQTQGGFLDAPPSETDEVQLLPIRAIVRGFPWNGPPGAVAADTIPVSELGGVQAYQGDAERTAWLEERLAELEETVVWQTHRLTFYELHSYTACECVWCRGVKASKQRGGWTGQ